MDKSPCLNCPNRKMYCHGECEKYIEFDRRNKVRNDYNAFRNLSVSLPRYLLAKTMTRNYDYKYCKGQKL